MSDVRVAIVGAGFAGIGAGLRLRDSGEDSFVVLERADAVGGTWRDNTYPGVACDVPAHLYCFSFLPNPAFTRRFAPGEEIRAYLERAALPVRDRLRLNTTVQQANWQENHWSLQTSAGDLTADILVLAAGRLTQPRFPDVPGEFAGPIFHTSVWDRHVDLTGRRVAVVGTGASGVQVIPHIAAAADSLVVLQRTPSYVLPRADESIDVNTRRRYADEPSVLEHERARLFDEAEALYDARVGNSDARRTAREAAVRHLEEQIRDPRLREKLTPTYEFGCKRVLFSDDYYRALNSPTTTVSGPLTGFAPHAVRTADETYEVDVVVLATGFHTTRQPYAELVVGRGGRTLAQAWADGMRAYASTSVHGFPNMFVLDGPNASLSHNSAVVMIEAQIEQVLGAVATRHPGDVFEVRPDAEQWYVDEMDIRSRDKAWMSGCANWYVDRSSGRQVMLWPGTAREFRSRFGAFDESAYIDPRAMQNKALLVQ